MFGFASVLEEGPLGFVARAGGGGAVVAGLTRRAGWSACSTTST